MKSKKIWTLLSSVVFVMSANAGLVEDVKIGVPSWTGAQVS